MKKSLKLFISILLFNIPLVKSQNLSWVQKLNTPTDNYNVNIAVDSLGNIFTGGFFNGSTDFDPGPGTFILNGANEDIYITKQNTNGDLIWAKKIGGNYYDRCLGIAIDDSANVYAVGFIQSSDTVDFDPGPGLYRLPPFGNKDMFVLKLDSSGNFKWAGRMGASASDQATSIVCKNNSIAITGNFMYTVDFQPGSAVSNLTASASSSESFTAVYDLNGNLKWVKQYGLNRIAVGTEVKMDNQKNVYTCGQLTIAPTDLDPGAGVVTVNTGTFIQKLDSTGTFKQCLAFNMPTGVQSNFFEVDKNRNVYTAGTFLGKYEPNGIFYNQSSLPYNSCQSGNSILKFSKIDPNGDFIWGKSICGNYSLAIQNFITDDSLNIYVTGGLKGTGDFNPDTSIVSLTAPNGIFNGFIAKYNSQGEFYWAGLMPGAHNLTGRIGFDASGHIIVNGVLLGAVDFELDTTQHILNSGTILQSYTAKYLQNNCSGFLARVDSVTSRTCLDSGSVYINPLTGAAPYTYSYNSQISYSSPIKVTDPGNLNITVTDNSGCNWSATYIVGGVYEDRLDTFDLRTNLISERFRPGGLSTVIIGGYNDGCNIVSGTLKLVYDSILTLQSSNIPPDSIDNNTLIWNFTNMSFESILANLYFSVPTSAQIGQNVCFDISMDPLINDADPSNNYKHYCFPIVNSFDPNDLNVHPAVTCEEGSVYADQVLTYTVRFQNTGTAEAIDVVILDTLPPTLNTDSIRIIASSHRLIAELVNNSVLKLAFDSIMLPDSLNNEPLSHGYVVFEIKQLPALSVGSQINNHVEIYFDHNPPVYTNSVNLTIVSPMDVTTSTNAETITANEINATYQWINCATDSAIAGATNASYTASANGNYAVILTRGVCSETSTCVAITSVGMKSGMTINNSELKVMPNPNEGSFTIKTTREGLYTIVNELGQTIQTIKINAGNNYSVSITNLKAGIYFIVGLDNNARQKIVVTN